MVEKNSDFEIFFNPDPQFDAVEENTYKLSDPPEVEPEVIEKMLGIIEEINKIEIKSKNEALL